MMVVSWHLVMMDFFISASVWLSAVAGLGYDHRLVFFDTSDEVLVKRYSETRRRHPLSHQGMPLSDAIALQPAGLRHRHPHPSSPPRPPRRAPGCLARADRGVWLGSQRPVHHRTGRQTQRADRMVHLVPTRRGE